MCMLYKSCGPIPLLLHCHLFFRAFYKAKDYKQALHHILAALSIYKEDENAVKFATKVRNKYVAMMGYE